MSVNDPRADLMNEGEKPQEQGETGQASPEGAAPSDGGSGPAVPETDRVQQLEQEVEALRDKWLRAVADLENHKKRVRRDIEEAKLQRTQELLRSFLPTVDNLERALGAVSGGADHADQLGQLVKGIEMVRNEFVSALERHGITTVLAVGEVFDPSQHDALQQVDSPHHPPGVIIQEFEKGYRQGERLLRPARVIVAGPGSAGGTEDSEKA